MRRAILALFAVFSLSAAGAEAPLPKVEIDNIQLTGITVFSQSEIEGTLEIEPGDKLERVKLVRTAENLQALYRMRGYEEVSIQSRLSRKKGADGKPESVLEFRVTEGKPTRIAGVSFVPESIRDRTFERYWARLEGSLSTKLEGMVDGLFDQEKISSVKRALQDLLASEEFIGAKVENVRVSTVERPLDVSVGRWVSLEFHIDLGDRVTFGFRGNTVFPGSHFSTLIEEQRLLGFGKDYVGAIRMRIEAEYRSLGYASVKVVPYTFERPSAQERHVTYVIEEGPRVGIDSVTFDGNSVFTSAELRKRFFERASVEVQHGHYVEKEAAKAAELVIEWMKSKGYLEAKLVTVNSLPVEGLRPYEGSKVRLVIYVYEGDQTTVQSVTISGASIFPEYDIKKRLGVHETEPLNLFAFGEGLESLKGAYRAKGYLGMRIVNEGSNQVVRYSQENRWADITVQISEGTQYRVSKIHVDGLAQTKEYVLRRDLLFKEGDVLTEPDLIESESRLRRIGLFSLATLKVTDDPDREGYKVVRVSVQEGTPGIVAGGVGFRNDLGPRVFTQFGYGNLFGRNQTASINMTVNRRLEDYRLLEGQVQFTYLWPWFLFTDLTFRPTFTISSAQYKTFDAYTISAAGSLERQFLKRPKLTGVITYNIERIRQLNAKEAVDEQDLQVGSVTPILRLDMRDNPLAPTSGLFATASYEFAAPWLGSQRDPFPLGYTRFQFRSDYYWSPLRDVTWYFSFRTGFERSMEAPIGDPDDPDNASGVVPLIKQFALGGPGSLRGFKEQELNKQHVKITGTLAYVNYRTQLDLPFSGALRFGPFLDAANLVVDTFTFGDLRYGVGVGLHYATPVGPVNLDWGFKIDPRPGEDTTQFHFSIGVI